MEEGRQIEPRKIAEIDLSSIWAFPVKRTEMPYLDMESRKNTYEETTTGFSAEAVADEAQRCLSCALCSECLECVKVCKSNAIKHEDTVRHKDAEADFVLRFPAGAISVNEENPGAGKNGVYVINQRTDLPEGDVNVRLLAAVMQTILDSDIDFLDKLSAAHLPAMIRIRRTFIRPSRMITHCRKAGKASSSAAAMVNNNNTKLNEIRKIKKRIALFYLLRR